MLATPPEEKCAALPSVTPDSPPLLRTSPSPKKPQRQAGPNDAKSDISRSSSKISLSAPSRREGVRRRRPPSPLKGFETYSSQTYQHCNSSMSTPGSHASAVPVTPHALNGDGIWLSSEFSPTAFFSPFDNAQLELPDLARKVKDITRSPQFVNEATIGHHLLDLTPYRAILVRHLETHGFVILCFHDSRDTMKVYNKLLISSVRFNRALGPVSLQCTAIRRDVVRAKVWKDSVACIDVTVKGPVTVAGVKIFRAEYYDARAASKAVQVLDGAQIGDFKFTVKITTEKEGDPFLSRPISPSPLPQPSSAPQYTFASAAYGNQHTRQTFLDTPNQRNEAFGPSSSAPRTASRFTRSFSNSFELPQTQPPSPTVRSTISRTHSVSAGTADWARITRNGTHDESLLQSQTQAPRWSDPVLLQSVLDQMSLTARVYQQTSAQQPVVPHNPQAIPVENIIHKDRIINGLDKRTTVMIKDVPNKLSREELVSILREVVPNEFDFVYLRFDFNNHCNVGYAFVNFTSIQALLTFVELKAGRKWNLFASEKVLQVSTRCFEPLLTVRNSHVMDALEEWRPQIFYSDGALKGQPEPFPEADHPARHQQRGSFSRAPFVTGASGSNGGSISAGHNPYRQAAA
ncbi:hypothetical protein A1Q2_03510 [Trichosporon asahii var. asahii CBS 8904]|uniref:Mei2-like C-terminal RNA recognition motif domain-containing protein n=1 Tax=Trichosporon asahii var. asahii (strain CBS 8904) TaxID=1220162 RepID=K1VZG9_TRIAC|nr:hypothetical protein A1Q2_03510 [Trichosporon asahii var. asahii CBS 8904]